MKILQEFHQLTISNIVLLLLISFIFFSLSAWFIESTNYYYSSKKKSKKTPPPEASGAWPVIGHLHQFKPDDLPHEALGNMADKYGPVFIVRFGSYRKLVVSNSEMVKECFTAANDRSFSNRPAVLGIRIMLYNTITYAFAPYGPYWRELRRISSQNLLSNHRVDVVKHLHVDEVNTSFKQLYESCNKNGGRPPTGINTSTSAALVNMDDWLSNIMFNVIARIVNGNNKSVNNERTGAINEKRYKKAMDEARRLVAIFAVSDSVPWLGWLDRVRGLIRGMNLCGKELDSIIEDIIDEHRQKRRLCTSKLGSSGDDDADNNNLEEEDNFIDACLSIEEQSQLPGENPEIVIKALILDMFAGGSDGPHFVLTWTLALLLNHPHVLKKAREEVDAHVANDRHVDVSDISNLVYIQAILKESMRLYPPNALIERMTTEDCEVGGYHIPAGTYLLVNVWKVQRDPTVWQDPSEFRPERFLLTNTKTEMEYEHIPFGAGRRRCPGMRFALQVMHLVLARLIHEFEITTPMDVVKVDMTATNGLFNHKAVPLEVMLTPRTHIRG